MQLYSYWARATLACRSAAGRPFLLTAYGGSDTSPAAAQAAAGQLLRQRQARLLQEDMLGQYPSGTAPLREELLERLYDPQGELLGALTRNHYGSLVLNAPRFMMLDVDDHDLRPQPDPLARRIRRLLRALFRLAPPPPLPPPPTPHELLQQRLAAWLALYPEWNFRLYRTRLGFRLLVTHHLLAPGSPEAQAAFAALRTDRLYVQLCLRQDCYRARLSPKPWRIGWSRPPHPFPFDTPEQQLQQQAWLEQYHARSQRAAVCEWVGEYGSGQVLPGLRPLIALHDQACLGGPMLA